MRKGWMEIQFFQFYQHSNSIPLMSPRGILLSDGFMGEDFAEEVLHAEIWRTSVAHDSKYMDLAQTSLVP